MHDSPQSVPEGLARLGFTERERALFASLDGGNLDPARVIRVDRGLPLVASASGIERVEPAMHLVKSGERADSRAVVGDWVALLRHEGHDMPILEVIMPRHSAFSRKDPGEETDEQVLIANVDIVFVVQSLSGGGVNSNRLERELVMAWDSGARPVVVLTKADMSDCVEEQRKLAEELAFGVDVIVESALTGEGIDEVLAHIPVGITAVLLGGSGVGKSTLINRILGEELQATQEVRAGDDKGRHTTVARELIELPSGGVIIDTPGMRGLALWDAQEGLAAAFPDIEEAAQACRFRDCSHDGEPGCGVAAAVAAGEIPERRLASYLRLMTELELLTRKQDERAWREKEQTTKTIAKAVKQYYKTEPKRKGR